MKELTNKCTRVIVTSQLLFVHAFVFAFNVRVIVKVIHNAEPWQVHRESPTGIFNNSGILKMVNSYELRIFAYH